MQVTHSVALTCSAVQWVKKPEEMVKQRQIFLEGAGQKGIDESTANHIFDYMEKFAGYGFNKSHAAAYALVAYHTAWLKPTILPNLWQQ